MVIALKMKLQKYIVLVTIVLLFPRAVYGQPIVTCDLCIFSDIPVVLGNILNFLFKLAIPITVGMIVFGAIQLIVGRGSPDKVKQAKSTMVKAVIGLVIVLASYLIVKTVQMILTSATA